QRTALPVAAVRGDLAAAGPLPDPLGPHAGRRRDLGRGVGALPGYLLQPAHPLGHVVADPAYGTADMGSAGLHVQVACARHAVGAGHITLPEPTPGWWPVHRTR